VWRATALALGAIAGMSCGASNTGPDVPFSIQFFPPQLPSMIIGDQLHDTLGNIDSLHAVTFNAAGDSIPNAPIRFVHADTTSIVDVDSISGHVTARAIGFARVVAQASTLQSPPETLFVVLRPDHFGALTEPFDTLDFSTASRDSLFPLAVALSSAGTPVDHWRIEYRFIYPADLNTPDSTRVLLSDVNRKFSLIDTTGVGITGVAGTARRYLRITALSHSFNDTVVVEATAFYPDHTVVPGSPARFTVLVHIP
jgi:hypothetical protein